MTGLEEHLNGIRVTLATDLYNMSERDILVSVIIVNWNGRSFLKDCLDAITHVSYSNIEIIFVDNASVDDSADFVRKNYPSLKIFVNEENLGVGGGFEIGMKKAMGQAILLLNTDAIVPKKILATLTKVLYSNKKIGAVQPKLVLSPSKKQIDSIGCLFLGNGDLYHIGRERDPNLPEYNKQMEIFSTKGACMLIKKEVVDKTGLFDGDFFAYFEDTDFCIRILLAGYTIVYDPTETVYHKGGATSKSIMHTNILFHSYKNRIYSYLKNFSIKYILRVMPLMLCMYQVACFGYIITGRFTYALAVERGILWNVINIQSILKKRKFVQEHIRKISDDEFIPRLTRSVRLKYYWYQFFGGIEKYKD